MQIIDALVRRTRLFREVVDARAKAIEDSRRWLKAAEDENNRNLDLLKRCADLEKQLKTFIPYDVHIQVVSAAERLKFVNEANEATIRTYEQKIYDLEHPVKITTAAWEPEDEETTQNPPPKKSRKNATKKLPKIFRGRRTKK